MFYAIAEGTVLSFSFPRALVQKPERKRAEREEGEA
jgi:hypothetical protein